MLLFVFFPFLTLPCHCGSFGAFHEGLGGSQAVAQPTPATFSYWQGAASLASSHFSLKCSSEKASSRERSFFLSELEGNENEQ